MIRKDLLKNIRLIVFDLDGTLLTSDNRIGSESIRLVNELRKYNVRFSFATGRLHSAIIEHAETLSLKTPLISLDGSLIKNYPEDNIIFESYIPAKYVKKAIALADKLLLKIALCHGDAIYYTEHNSSIEMLLDNFGAKFEEIKQYGDYVDKTLELVVSGEYKDPIKYLANKMAFPYTFGLSTSYYKSHRRGDIYYFEARKQGVNKGTGLKKLASHLGIKISETAVMGDWYNDRHMFDTGALKIAVANAVPEIKHHADLITKKTNDEDAAAEFLQMVLQAKKN